MANSIFGVFLMGVIVGYLLCYFLKRFDKYDWRIFSGLVTFLFGGVFIRLFENLNAIWSLYPLGIIGGWVLYAYVAIKFGADPEGTVFGKILGPRKKKKP